MTTAATEYNNDDEWHIHRDSMLGLSPGGISNTFFNDAAVDDEDDEPEPGEEFELVDDVAVDTGFFDEEDVIGYYVSYDQHDANNNNNNDDDDDDDSGEEDEDEEEFIPPCPPVDPMAATATATSFRTPTTPTTTTTATTTRPQDDRAVTASSTTTKANANAAASTEPKRKRTRRDPNKPKGWLSPVFLYSNANRAKVKSENPDASFGDICRILSSEYKNLPPNEMALWQQASDMDKARHNREMEAYNNSSSSGSSTTITFPAVVPSILVPRLPPFQLSGGVVSVSSSNDHVKKVDVSGGGSGGGGSIGGAAASTLVTTGIVHRDYDEKDEDEEGCATVVVMAPKKAKRSKKTKDPNEPKGRRNAWNFFTGDKNRPRAYSMAKPGAPFHVITTALAREFKELSPSERAYYDNMSNADKVRYEKEMTRWRQDGGGRLDS